MLIDLFYKCVVIVFLWCVISVWVSAEILKVSAGEQVIEIHTKAVLPDGVVVRAYAPFEEGDGKGFVVGDAKANGNKVVIPRFNKAGKDLIYERFALYDSKDKRLEHGVSYVTDLSMVGVRKTKLPEPRSKKGLQAIVDVEDGISLGVKHVTLNINLPALLDLSKRSGLVHDVDGERFHFKEHVVNHYDREIVRYSKAGIKLYFILLNYLPRNHQEAHPMVHPMTNREASPNRLGGFNTTNVEGYRAYRALIEFLGERYSREDKKYGLVSGYIVGNELQSHWHWYNIGDVPRDVVLKDYARTFRITDTAVKRYHGGLRVFVSMDHFWGRAHRPDEPGKSMSGKYFLDTLARILKHEGDFAWDIAFHPYPENLRNPRTWEDRTAEYHFDSPRITFKNIEVLTAYLKQERLKYKGKVRRVILSEQGFDLPKGPDGEKVQAAGFVYAYYRVGQIEGIDAFILHRYVDHANEGGLRFGLLENKPGTITTPGRKRLLYDVFKAADGDEWEKAFEFAKPILKIQSWGEIGPREVKVKR